MNRLPILLLVVLMAGCATQYQGDEKSPYFVVPAGSSVTLHQELNFPPTEVGVYFQGGAIVAKGLIDQYRPHCRIEIKDRQSITQQVVPDTFTVVRATQDLFHSVQLPVLVAENGSRHYVASAVLGRESSPQLFGTRMNLRSERQPNVIRLTCGHLQTPDPQARHLSIEQIRQTLGNIITLQLATAPKT